MHFYTIYTIDIWSVLAINNLILTYIYHPWVHHIIITRQTCCNYAFDIIVPVYFTLFQIYNITSYDTSYDYDHMPFHHPKEKEKENQRKMNKNKIKYQSSNIL